MKKVLYLLIAFLCNSIVSNAQNFNHSQFVDNYPKLFQVTVEKSKDYSFVLIYPNNKLDTSDVFSDLTNNNTLYLDYILENYSSFERSKLDEYKNDPEKLKGVFIEELKKDSYFQKYVNPLLYWYLSSKQRLGSGKNLGLLRKEKISKEQLFTTASKFFHAVMVKPDSSVYFKVCVGLNGFKGKSVTSESHPLVEAFCFMTVMDFAQIEGVNYYRDFKLNVKKLSKEYLTLSSEQRLSLIREKMYQIMGNNEDLRKILLSEYERKKNILSFELE